MNAIPRNAERLNSLSHLIALIGFSAAVPFLIVKASMTMSPLKIVSTSLYSASLLLLYFFSVMHHSMPSQSLRNFWLRFDHVGIYLLIAGTYTPYLLVTLEGAWGWSLFGVIWGLAVTGIVIKAIFVHRFVLVTTLLYLLMGWIIVVAIGPLVERLSAEGLRYLVWGGIFYSVGSIFFVTGRKYPWLHPIWHIFVIAGSVAHFISIFRAVV